MLYNRARAINFAPCTLLDDCSMDPGGPLPTILQVNKSDCEGTVHHVYSVPGAGGI